MLLITKNLWYLFYHYYLYCQVFQVFCNPLWHIQCYCSVGVQKLAMVTGSAHKFWQLCKFSPQYQCVVCNQPVFLDAHWTVSSYNVTVQWVSKNSQWLQAPHTSFDNCASFTAVPVRCL